MEIEPEKPKTILEQFSILKEFQDVFPDEISRFPPERYLDFTIDLIPVSTHISWYPYHMSIPKPTKPRMQLQQLLDKKYIQPSMSPWGAPILFVKMKDDTFIMCID